MKFYLTKTREGRKKATVGRVRLVLPILSILADRAVTVSGHEIVTCVVGEMVMVGKWVTMVKILQWDKNSGRSVWVPGRPSNACSRKREP